MFNSIRSFLGATETSPASPIYAAIDTLGPYVLGVVTLLCTLYGIVLGVRLAKAEDKEQRKNVQKTLINFAIGAGSVIVLLVVLYAIRDYL